MERTSWTDQKLESELRTICISFGHFPSCQELRSVGRNDIACALSRYGGFLKWSERLGFARAHSDSDTGWQGEDLSCELLAGHGMSAMRVGGVKNPFDVLVEGIVRADIKAASYAEYGTSRGWFYRVGKVVQSDVVIFVQLDTRDAYVIPWHLCPTSNISFAREGVRYAKWFNNFEYLKKLVACRQREVIELVA